MKNYTNELYLFYSAFIIRDCLYWHRYRKREFEGEGKIWKNVQRYRHCCQGISEWDSPIDGDVFNGKSPIEKNAICWSTLHTNAISALPILYKRRFLTVFIV